MSRTRHEQVGDIFATARCLAAAQREAYLDEVCGGDAGLRADVEALLAQVITKINSRGSVTSL